MTAPAPPSVPRPPGRGWYVVAVVIALTGWVGMALAIYSGLRGAGERMLRLLVPGQAEFRLDEPGTYTIFHEYRSTFDGRVYDVGGLPGLQITVRHRGTALELRRATGTSYTIGGHAGRSLFSFEVSEPGLYQVAGAYGDGRKTPQTVLAIDRGFVGTLVTTVLGALAFGFGGMGLAAAVFVSVFVRRRRALRPRA